MKTAFVTGGSGFLGMNLVHCLVEANWNVVSMDLSSSNNAALEKLGVQCVAGDITDHASCEQLIPENTNAVFHVAGNVSHWKLGDALQTLVNVDGTRNMIEAALKKNVHRFIYTSSIAAYGFQPHRVTESTPSTADNFWINYFRTKRLAELEVHKGIRQGLDAVILNPSNIIGPYDLSGWSRLFHLINENRLPGNPPGSGSFCHSNEVAKAHIAAYENGRCGHNYLLGGVDATFQELAQEIGKLLGKKVPARPTPAFVLKIIGRLSQWGSYVTKKDPDLTPEKALLVSSDLVCSTQKAIDELGYSFQSLSSMLKDCYLWLLDEKLILS